MKKLRLREGKDLPLSHSKSTAEPGMVTPLPKAKLVFDLVSFSILSFLICKWCQHQPHKVVVIIK